MIESRQHSFVPMLLAISWLVITLFLWFLAFYSASEATPEWLLRAQSACFGTTKTGLPDTYGWMVLTLSPLSLIAALYIATKTELIYGWRRLQGSPAGRTLIGLLLLVVVVESAWVSRKVNRGMQIAYAQFENAQTDALPDNYPTLHKPAADFSLVSQLGKEVTLKSVQGQAVLLSFAFAHCQTICPSIVKQLERSLGRTRYTSRKSPYYNS